MVMEPASRRRDGRSVCNITDASCIAGPVSQSLRVPAQVDFAVGKESILRYY